MLSGFCPLKVIVPVTQWKERYAAAPWMIRLEPDAENGLEKPSAADTFQVRSLSQTRFVERLGKLSEEALQRISNGLAVVLSIG